jgi:sphingomyelin phosphodiesterase
MKLFLAVVLGIGIIGCGLAVPLFKADSSKTGATFDEIQDQIFNLGVKPQTRGLTCDLCKLLINGIRQLIAKNKTEEEIDKFVRNTCVNLQIEQPYVCDKIIEEFGNEIYFAIEHSYLEPHEFCGAFIKECGTYENPLNQPWPLTIPGNKPAVKPWPTVPDGKPKMRVLHLADIHVDREYAIGSESLCSNDEGFVYAFCCRDYPPDNSAGGKAAIKFPAPKWGIAENCDIPFITFDESMRLISLQEKFDYIIVTGDLESHAIWDYEKETTAANIANITATLLKYFPGIPVYQAVGNHEGVPMDAFAPHSIPEYETRGPQWLYTVLNDNWGHWIPDSVKESLQYRGSYSFHPFDNLKLISLNTVYCSHWNFYLFINATDPDLTLDWLAKELLDSEQKGEKVHIISHIPSGDSYCLKSFSANYYSLINRFENTIAAQFFGHTHNDHFYMYFDDANPKNRPTHTAFVAPSLTTYSYLNPAYRVYTIDGNYPGSSFTVLDEENYWANLTEVNANDKLEFKLEYNKRQDYNMKDLSPASHHDLLMRMVNDSALLDKYITHFYRNTKQVGECDPACRKKIYL